MTYRRDGLRAARLLPLVAAATTWVAMLSWRPFTELPGRYLGPLLVVGLVVVGTGALGRWRGLHGVLTVPLQAIAGFLVASWLLTGDPLPLGPGWAELELAFRQAVDDARQYAPPVPATTPGVHPLLVAGGLACFLLVDVLVATLRRLSLSGLPLLTIYSVPVSVVGGGLTWWIFVLTAAGFLTMLFLHESEQVDRWGRPVETSGARARADVRTGRMRATAGLVGGTATLLAVAVPVVIPTLDVRLVDLGPGAGGGDITLSNPMTDLKRDLVLGEDLPLLRIRTDDPDPSYLRIAVLTSYEGETWSAGDRDVPVDNLADGELPPLVGVDAEVRRRAYAYEVDVFDSFDSTWLPTMPTSTRVEAEGDWRYDVQTRDFLAGDDDLDTSGLSYSMTGVELQYDAADLATARSLGNQISPQLTEVPDDMPAEVRELALDVTRAAPTRFEKAVALQRWFRETGGFTYSTAREAGNGTDDLLAFLRSDGRVGYCEQFSAAMAIMARTLGIPARVAVGFLQPDPVGARTWEYSTRDLHAWPELFFPGSGWVRFEPTPSQRALTAPAWTQQEVPAVDPAGGPTANPSAGPRTPDRADATEEPTPDTALEAAADTDDPGRGAALLVGSGAVAALLAALALLPRAVRARRRARRRVAGPEEAWAELRDTAIDLGLAWPTGRSPRLTRDWLAPRLVGVSDRSADVQALDRIVRSVEEVRYSPHSDGGRTLRDELRTVIESLRDGATPGARRLADWYPRSLVGSNRPRRAAEQSGAAPQGSAVDQMQA